MARSAGSVGRRPVCAWPSDSLRRNALTSVPGIAALRVSSQRGRCQKRCSASSSVRPQRGHAVRPPFHRRAVCSNIAAPAMTARSAPA
eukprot:11210553-Lingulodinium_polyedra.AAC.1